MPYNNPQYVSPNQLCATEKKAAGSKYASKVKKRAKRTSHIEKFQAQAGELDSVFEGDDDAADNSEIMYPIAFAGLHV